METAEGFILPIVFLQIHVEFSIGYEHSLCLLFATSHPVVLLCALLWRDHTSQAMHPLCLSLEVGGNTQPANSLTAFRSSDGKSHCIIIQNWFGPECRFTFCSESKKSSCLGHHWPVTGTCKCASQNIKGISFFAGVPSN